MSNALKKVHDLHPVDVVKDHVSTVEVATKVRRFLPASLQRKAVTTAVKIGEKSPTILFVAGVTAGVGATVLACRSTLKAPLLIEEHRVLRDEIKELNNEAYSEKDRRRDVAVLYAKTGVSFAKLYGPSFALGVLAIASLTGSHKILGNRYTAVSAAYAGVIETFEQYRGRVREDVGEEKDREYRYGKQTVTEVVDGPNGPKKVKRDIAALDGDKSLYARLWDENTSKEWKRHGDSNKAFLQISQSFADDKLKANGVLFLNDVYKMLGLQPTPEGQIAGWVYRKGENNYVSFGLFEDNFNISRFFETPEGGVWLDFNCEPDVVDALKNI